MPGLLLEKNGQQILEEETNQYEVGKKGNSSSLVLPCIFRMYGIEINRQKET